MAITNDTVLRAPTAPTQRAGNAEYVARATASAIEDATFDLTQFGFLDPPLVLGGIAISAAGGVYIGVKTLTATSLVVTVSGACTFAATFTGKTAP